MYLYTGSDALCYIRFMRGDSVVRVAVMNPAEGRYRAFYPSEDKTLVNAEAFSDVDANTVPRPIRRDTIKDSLLLDLVDGKKVGNITSAYEPGYDDTFYFSPRGSEVDIVHAKLFRIVEAQEPVVVST